MSGLCFLWSWTLCMYVDLSTALTRRLDIDKAAVRLSSGPGLDDGRLAFDVALFLGDGRTVYGSTRRRCARTCFSRWSLISSFGECAHTVHSDVRVSPWLARVSSLVPLCGTWPRCPSLLSWTARGAHLSIIRVRQSSMLDPRAEYVPQAKSTYMYVGRLLADGGARVRSTATAAGEYGELVGSFIWTNRGADARLSDSELRGARSC